MTVHYPICLSYNTGRTVRLQLVSLLPTNPANDFVKIKTMSKRYATSE